MENQHKSSIDAKADTLAELLRQQLEQQTAQNKQQEKLKLQEISFRAFCRNMKKSQKTNNF